MAQSPWRTSKCSAARSIGSERTTEPKEGSLSSPIPQFSPDALKAIRKESGVSRTKLAAAIDVSSDTIVNWEQGKSMPRVDLLGSACAVLGCELTDVVKVEAARPAMNDEGPTRERDESGLHHSVHRNHDGAGRRTTHERS